MPRKVRFAKPAAALGAPFLAVAVITGLHAAQREDKAVRPFAGAAATTPYVGSQACERCHDDAYKSWRRTLHLQMTKPLAEARIEGAFGEDRPVRFEAYGRSYAMEKRDGRYFISVAHGTRPAERFEVNYTLGVRRFQGYLSRLADGRIYVLPIFWHNESKRWVDWKEITPIPDDPNHDLRQIWNVTCVNCHATNLVKNFDVATKTYATKWTEMGIGCEACHGPGQAHIALMDEWAKSPASRPEFDDSSKNRELGRILQIFSPKSADPRQVFDTCGYCHGNKNNVFFGFKPGDRYEDYALPFLISQPIPDNDPQGEFWPDGKPSRFNRPQAIMQTGCFQRGQATCTNCHTAHGSKNSHMLKLEVETPTGGHTKQSDALCAQCHQPVAARLSEHTHHPADSPGSRCIECHMSDVNWRLITRRRDHTFQPPVPELTIKYGEPNACTTCHEDKTPEWAVATMDKWYGNTAERQRTVALADTFYRAGERLRPERGAGGKPGVAGPPSESERGWGPASSDKRDTSVTSKDETSAVLAELGRVAVDRSHGAPIRASAAEFIGELVAKRSAPPEPFVVNALVAAASDPEPIVRITAIRSLAVLDDARVVPVVAAHLTDPARVVRSSAAQALLDHGVARLDGAAGDALARAQEELATSLRMFNDVAADHTTLGWLEASRGQSAEAAAELRTAADLDPRAARPRVYLGIVAARAGKYDEALEQFHAAKKLSPDYANLDRLIEEAEKRLKAR